MNVRLVSAYIPLREGHRSHEEYVRLGGELISLPVQKSIYYDQIENCWMYDALVGKDYEPRHGGDEKKNTMNYHIVQHQKTTWMLRAAMDHPDAEVLVWMDYGIFHMDGISQEHVLAFLKECEHETAIAIPGAWPKGQDGGPCWRFNGSILICHRDHILALDLCIRAAAMHYAAKTGTVIWEVNTWDEVETHGTLPIRWYGATHNGSMLTAYKRTQP